MESKWYFTTMAHYADAYIVSQVCFLFIDTNLPLINHTVSNLFFFNDFCISYVFSILNFGPISRDTEVEFIVYLFLEFIRAEQGTYFSWKYYVFPEIFYSVWNLK